MGSKVLYRKKIIKCFITKKSQVLLVVDHFVQPRRAVEVRLARNIRRNIICKKYEVQTLRLGIGSATYRKRRALSDKCFYYSLYRHELHLALCCSLPFPNDNILIF